VKPCPFEYHAPETVEEAVEILTQFGDSAKILAGGQSLVPMLALRLTSFEHLVDLRRIRGLDSIDRRDGMVRVGAKVTESAVECSDEMAGAAPLVTRATPHIGHFQIRNRGTLCGSIAHADPAAEYPAVAVALGAEMEIISRSGSRTVSAEDFFTGYWSTKLRADELLTAVTFPVWKGRRGFGFQEFARRHGDFALSGAAIGIEADADDRITRCGIALLGMGSIPERARAAESAVLQSKIGEVSAKELGRIAISELESVSSDVHGSAAYRKRIGAAMVERAWQEAQSEVMND
jgi:aerobic carbon-monoxide dehydrogenase medium subunit